MSEPLDLPVELERTSIRCEQSSLTIRQVLSVLAQESLKLIDVSGFSGADGRLAFPLPESIGEDAQEIWQALPELVTGAMVLSMAPVTPECPPRVLDLANQAREPIIHAMQQARSILTSVRERLLPRLDVLCSEQSSRFLKREFDSLKRTLDQDRAGSLKLQTWALSTATRTVPGEGHQPAQLRNYHALRQSAACWGAVELGAATLPSISRSLHRIADLLRPVYSKPQFPFSAISAAAWVLECEDSSTQGTAFALQDYGLVTCDHVLGPTTKAFQTSSLHTKKNVTVRAREPALDLAILTIDGSLDRSLPIGSADNLKPMDQIAVFGYPNFRFGDTGTLVPGQVVGFRIISGVRRILTDAPIISGVSGGPVVDAAGRVIGVAVTGAEKMERAHDTEHHGIIPIEALRYLRNGA